MTSSRLEKHEQIEGVKLLRLLRAEVYELGRPRGRGEADRGMRQTPGLPDVLAFLPTRSGNPPYVQLWWEVKRRHGGRLTPEQVAFQAYCRAAGQRYVCGAADVLADWLTQQGYIE